MKDKGYINTYDIDGVIHMDSQGIVGLHPRPEDMIITGRSWEEMDYTNEMLKKRGIFNQVWFSHVAFKDKTREISGYHKALVIAHLLESGYRVGCHFEDDPVQAKIIEKWVGKRVNVVLLTHEMTEKENKWRKE